jgi:hypothetical protein
MSGNLVILQSETLNEMTKVLLTPVIPEDVVFVHNLVYASDDFTIVSVNEAFDLDQCGYILAQISNSCFVPRTMLDKVESLLESSNEISLICGRKIHVPNYTIVDTCPGVVGNDDDDVVYASVKISSQNQSVKIIEIDNGINLIGHNFMKDLFLTLFPEFVITFHDSFPDGSLAVEMFKHSIAKKNTVVKSIENVKLFFNNVDNFDTFENKSRGDLTHKDIVMDFVNSKCGRKPGCKIQSSELFDVFRRYFLQKYDEPFESLFNPTNFAMYLKNMEFENRRSSKGIFWMNVCVL